MPFLVCHITSDAQSSEQRQITEHTISGFIYTHRGSGNAGIFLQVAFSVVPFAARFCMLCTEMLAPLCPA